MDAKRFVLIFLVVLVTLGALLAIAWFVPLPLNPYLDFQVLYRADQGILHGISLYDRAGQEQMVAEDLGVTADRVFVLPFPYPPWFALATLPLALLPIEIAVRLWFLLNISMLLISVWLVTDGWEPQSRLISFVIAPLFLPILGSLLVGQYVFPTILGMGMLIYALQKKQVVLIAPGAALLTFKPHVGVFVLLAVVIHLLLRRDEFGWRAFKSISATGVALFMLGFFADNNWFLNYWNSLFAFKNVISSCKLCTSLPLMLTEFVDLGFNQAWGISAVLTLTIVFLLGKIFPKMDGGFLVASSTSMALLVNPYLLNYDFTFAILPFLVIGKSPGTRGSRLLVLISFFLPWIGFALYGRGGNPTLLVSTIILVAVLLTQVDKSHTIVA